MAYHFKHALQIVSINIVIAAYKKNIINFGSP